MDRQGFKSMFEMTEEFSNIFNISNTRMKRILKSLCLFSVSETLLWCQNC